MIEGENYPIKGYKVSLNKKYVNKFKSRLIINGISTNRLNNQYYYTKKYNKPIIFSILGNWERKGRDIIFKAIEKINTDDTKVYLASIISKEKVKEKFGYVPEWFIDLEITENIKEYYEMADIFVSASRKETFSYALAEAIYCGLPCISSDIDGVQWAKEIKTVNFFSNDVNSLVEEIEKILNKKIDEYEYKQSKNYILNNYSEYTWSKKVIDLYTELHVFNK